MVRTYLCKTPRASLEVDPEIPPSLDGQELDEFFQYRYEDGAWLEDRHVCCEYWRILWYVSSSLVYEA